MSDNAAQLVVMVGAALLCLMLVAGIITLGLWVVRMRARGRDGDAS